MDYLEFLAPDEIRLKGHRIWLEHIVTRARQGKNAAEIVADFPTLTVEVVQAVLAYADTHRTEVDAYLARHEAFMAEQMRRTEQIPDSPVMARLRRLRDHLKAQGAEEVLAPSAES